MAIRTICLRQEDVLYKKSKPVEKFDKKLHTLLDDMQETLRHVGGLGLAAPQVGVLRRAVLVETEPDVVIELINPEITAVEGEQEGAEGCLSTPGLYGIVKRPMTVTVQAQDRFGNSFTLTGEGLTARAFCHETEHLDGILFTTHVIRYLTDEELEADG